MGPNVHCTAPVRGCREDVTANTGWKVERGLLLLVPLNQSDTGVFQLVNERCPSDQFKMRGKMLNGQNNWVTSLSRQVFAIILDKCILRLTKCFHRNESSYKDSDYV